MNEQDEKELTFGKLLEQFPRYFIGYLWGFVEGVLCDMTLTSLALASVAIALTTNWKVGVAVFFGGHFVIRGINAVSTATVVSGQYVEQGTMRVAQALHRLAAMLAPPQPEITAVDPPTDDEGSEA